MKNYAIFFDQPMSYQDGVILQQAILEARIKEQAPDVVLFLEHLPVITCGVRTKPGQILFSTAELKKKGIEVSASSRGGAVTFHCPGQIVMYPIVKIGAAGMPPPYLLNKSAIGRARASGPAATLKVPNVKSAAISADAHGYLHNLEETAIRTAADFGVKAYRRKGMTGTWTDKGKLAAIGVRFKRWVSWHGLSFNVDPDLSGFETIIPCGLTGEKVTSLKVLLGNKYPSLKQVRERLALHFSSVFGMEITSLKQNQFSAGQSASLISMLESQRQE
jgi:lipoate-protein ligase B